MYLDASQGFNQQIQNDRRSFRARLVCGNEEIDQIDAIRISGGSNNGETITIGSTISTQIEVEMPDTDYELSGKEWELSFGLLLPDGTYEYIPMGKYAPQKPSKNNGKTEFLAYDRMMKLSGIYVCGLADINTITVLNDISVQTGVPIDTSGLSALQMSKPTGYTYREVLMYIAQKYGKFANVNRNGIIQLHWWKESSGYKITPDNTRGFSHDEVPFLLGYIDCVTGTVENEEGEEQTIIISAGSGAQGIAISNPFMTQDDINRIHAEIGGFTYTPSSVKVPLGDIRLDPWDIITVSDRKEKEYKVPLMTFEYKYDGGISAVFSCVGYTEEQEEVDQKGPMQQFQERMEISVAKITRLVAESAKIDDLEALRIRTETLEADKITTNYLEANYAKITTLEAEYLKANEIKANYVTTERLLANYIDANTIGAQYARLDKTNIEDGWITRAMIGTGAIGTAQIADGSITDAKIISLTANKIGAGTIDAAKIEVINLNCANLTVGTINGQQIASGAVDMSKLDTALSGKITMTEAEVKQALQEAGLAQGTADRKNAVFYQDSPPDAEGRKVNDIWFDTSDSNKMHFWDGENWIEKQFGSNAIENESLTFSKFSDGAITGINDRISVGTRNLLRNSKTLLFESYELIQTEIAFTDEHGNILTDESGNLLVA